jgi:hypothetical protein
VTKRSLTDLDDSKQTRREFMSFLETERKKKDRKRDHCFMTIKIYI